MRRLLKNQNGMTVLELLVVLVCIGILVALLILARNS
jgi:prepilin-type N-terminal cleavage/methylation domain-containing protein